MEWISHLLELENRLRSEIAILEKEGSKPLGAEDSPAGDRSLYDTVKPRLYQIRAVLDECLCGRNAEERGRMDYEVRIKLPLFSHLSRIYDIGSLVRT